jgi:hypothetical protein
MNITEKLYNIFDYKFYISEHNDLSHLNNKIDAWNHWLNYGINEGRKTIFVRQENVTVNFDNFDWKKYINDHIDLKNIANKNEAWNHWINYGINEGRTAYSSSEEELSYKMNHEYINDEDNVMII